MNPTLPQELPDSSLVAESMLDAMTANGGELPVPEQASCSRGWGERCARAKSKRCRCACGGRNHGANRPKLEAKSKDEQDSLPPTDERFQLPYEGLWNQGAFCTIRVYRDDSGIPLIVATDESDRHRNTSVTNRIERVMFLAWQRLGRPTNCYFAEHYRGTRLGGMFAEEFDLVTFSKGLTPETSYFQGRPIEEFGTPEWRHIRVRESNPEQFFGAIRGEIAA